MTQRIDLPLSVPENPEEWETAWFKLNEALQKLNSGINSNQVTLEDQAENPIRVYPVIAYPRACVADLVAPASVGAPMAYHSFTLGPFSGSMQAHTTNLPSAWTSAEFVVPSGEIQQENTQYIQSGAATISGSTDRTGTFVWVTTVPTGFTDWQPNAVEVDWALGVTGVTTSGQATVTLTAQHSIPGSPDAEASKTYTESSGIISVAYGTDPLILTREDMRALDVKPGTSLQIYLHYAYSGVNNTTTTKFSIGRVTHNWK